MLAFLRATAGDDQVRQPCFLGAPWSSQPSSPPPLPSPAWGQWELGKEVLLRFLAEYIPKLRGRGVLPFCVDIKEVCVSTFLRDRAARVKTASLAPLIAVRLASACPHRDPLFQRSPLLWTSSLARPD